MYRLSVRNITRLTLFGMFDKLVQEKKSLVTAGNTREERVTRPLVVACIPAYDEEKCIGGVIVRTREFVDMVLVCDDGSSDLTGAIAEGLGAVVVRHDRNMGYGAAIQSLFKEASRLGADVVVTLDADGQHDPRDIPILVEFLETEDVDIILGSRFVDGGSSEAPGWRENGIKLITKLVSKNGAFLTDAQSGFRVYSRRAISLLALVEQGMGVSTEILLKAADIGLSIAEASINIKYDEHSSTHNPIIHGLDVMISTIKHLSIRRPLLFYGVPGLFSFIIACIFWVWTFQEFTISRTISTNITLIALSATIIGLMLMTTSIILMVLVSIIREKR